jgi:hypothetical protein
MFVYECDANSGPAALYLGSPSGLSPDAIWELWSPLGGEFGVGQQVAAFPEQDALVVTMKIESSFCADWGPMSLAVVRNASSPGAYLDDVVETPEFDAGEYSNYLAGVLDGVGPTSRLMVIDSTGDKQGMHLFDVANDGLEIAGTPTDWLSALPFADSVFDIGIPLGRELQAAVGSRDVVGGGTELLIWGRSVEDVGPSVAVETVSGCTFRAMAESPVDVPPEPPDDPDDIVGQKLPPEDRTGGAVNCGCAPGGLEAVSGATTLTQLLIVSGAFLARRRGRGIGGKLINSGEVHCSF